MPRGGARPGAGRKPKSLSEKIAEGNPGHRSLKKIEFNGSGGTGRRPRPPEYLYDLKRTTGKDSPLPVEIFEDTVTFLEPSECLNLISSALIADYAMAKYYLICAQRQLSSTAIVTSRTVKAKGVKTKNDGEEVLVQEFYITSFTEAMLRMQKNVLQTWSPIWDIVSRNSERLLSNPEENLIAELIAGRARRKAKGVPPEDEYAQYAKNSGEGTESGEI